MRVRTKIMLCMVWLLALALGSGGSLLISQSFSNMLEQEKLSAVDSYRMTVQTLQLVVDTGTQKDVQALSRTLKELAEQRDWATARLSLDDTVIYAGGDQTLQAADLSPDRSHCSIAILTTDDSQSHYLQASGIFSAGDATVALDLITDVTEIYTIRARQLADFRLIFLLLLLTGGIISWALASFLTKPLSRLSRATEEIARGNYAHRVTVRAGDEVGQLSRDFNTMAQQLETNVTELQDAMQRQEQFMGSFAHELKTPMTSIIGYADLLRTQSLPPEEQMDAANYIFSEGKRLESLSLKLLELLVMKHQEPALSRVEPEQLISNLVQHLRPIYQNQGVRLQFRCKPGACMLDPDLIRSLLVNLADNARKAMDHGGNVYIVSDWLEDACRIRVLDNGRGMPEQAIAHITEAFYRVDKSRSRAQGGAGLGLMLCNEIVQLHGGSITFDSRVGNGTCVTVLLKGGRL